MNQIYEYEEKFFCSKPEDIIHYITENLHFSFAEKVTEKDIYFQDPQKNYLTKTTCLRLRITNNTLLELTSKKTANIQSRVKTERNISLPLCKKDKIIRLLNRIGFLEYSTVFKERFIYKKNIKNITCHLMIDILNDKYTFLEIEFLTKKRNFNVLKKYIEEISKELQKFHIEKTLENYRDFIKNKTTK